MVSKGIMHTSARATNNKCVNKQKFQCAAEICLIRDRAVAAQRMSDSENIYLEHRDFSSQSRVVFGRGRCLALVRIELFRFTADVYQGYTTSNGLTSVTADIE
jgi:hypothetical protein